MIQAVSYFYFFARLCRGQGDTDYHGSNGQADTHSLHSSHLSVQDDPLLIRTHKQQTSQQVRLLSVMCSTVMVFTGLG